MPYSRDLTISWLRWIDIAVDLHPPLSHFLATIWTRTSGFNCYSGSTLNDNGYKCLLTRTQQNNSVSSAASVSAPLPLIWAQNLCSLAGRTIKTTIAGNWPLLIHHLQSQWSPKTWTRALAYIDRLSWHAMDRESKAWRKVRVTFC
jgi:hypothetical protein